MSVLLQINDFSKIIASDYRNILLVTSLKTQANVALAYRISEFFNACFQRILICVQINLL